MNPIQRWGYNFASKALGYDRMDAMDANTTATMTSPKMLASRPKPTSPNAPKKTSTSDKLAAENAALDKQLAALEYQIQQQPRLPFFNSTANWATSQKKAASVTNPVYTDKMNRFLKRQKMELKQNRAQANTDIREVNIGVGENLEDSALQRVRTGEDVEAKLGESRYQEGLYQDTEGRSFDKAYQALAEDVASSGLATSGKGQQAIGSAVTERNIESADTVRGFEKDRETTELFKTRTFADLDKGDVRVKATGERSKEQTRTNLRNYIENQQLEKSEKKVELEGERQNALFNKTLEYEKLGVNDFINSLIKGGARAQDIALAKQVYG